VDEVRQGMGCVVYLYLTGFWQASGGVNGKVSDRLGAGRCTAGCGRGRYLSVCAGGITVVYSVAVSFP